MTKKDRLKIFICLADVMVKMKINVAILLHQPYNFINYMIEKNGISAHIYLFHAIIDVIYHILLH